MDFICAYCKQDLEIVKVRQLGFDVSILLDRCDCQCFKDCDNCDKAVEIEEEITAPLMQAMIDIEGNDEKIKKIREVGQKFGGEFEKTIENILEED